MSTRRPGVLTAICILGLILAALGALNGLCGIVGVAVQLTGQNFGPPPPPDMKAFQDQWFPVSATLVVLKLAVVCLLFYGCLAALNLWESGRKWLLIAMWSGIAFELIQIYPTVAIQMQVFELIKDDLHQPPMGPGGPSPEQFFEMIKGLSVAIGVGFPLLRLGFYAWGVTYASKDSTRQLFEQAAQDDEEDFEDDPQVPTSSQDDDPYR